jgi:hypothetical protein
MPTLVNEMLADRWPEDDDEETVMGQWLPWYGEKITGSTIGMVPGVRDVYRMYEDDYGRPVSLFGKMGGSMRRTYRELVDGDDDTSALFWAAVDSAGYFAPIPSSQFRISGRQFWEWYAEEREDLSLFYYSKGE